MKKYLFLVFLLGACSSNYYWKNVNGEPATKSEVRAAKEVCNYSEQMRRVGLIDNNFHFPPTDSDDYEIHRKNREAADRIKNEVYECMEKHGVIK